MFHLHFVPGFQTKKAEFFWFRLSLYHFQQIGWCLSVWQCMCANIFIVWDDILPIRELCRLSECFFLGVSNIGRKGILKSHRKDIIILLLFVDFDYLIHSFNFSFICLIIYIIFHLIFFLFVNFSPFNIFMFAIFWFLFLLLFFLLRYFQFRLLRSLFIFIFSIQVSCSWPRGQSYPKSLKRWRNWLCRATNLPL